MQNSKKLLLLVLISIIVLTLTIPASSLALSEQIFLATGEWAPYTSEKSPGQGFATEIVSAVITEVGFELNVKFFPWSRAKTMVKNNKKYIGSFPWVITDERKKSFEFSDSIFLIKTKFFYYHNNMGDVTWTRLEDLKKYRIGGTQDYSYMKDFEKAGIKVDTAPIGQLGFKKLVADRIDLFPCAEVVGWGIIKELYPNQISKFRVLDKTLEQGSCAVMCSKNNPNAPKFIKKFNNGLKQIKEKGIYKKILNKYGLQE